MSDNNPTIKLEERVIQLEAEVQRLRGNVYSKWWIALLSATAVVFWIEWGLGSRLIAAITHAQFPISHARMVDVTDGAYRLGGTEIRPGRLICRNEKGKRRIEIGCNKMNLESRLWEGSNATEITVNSAAGNPRIRLQVLDNGNAEIHILDDAGNITWKAP